MAKWRIEVKAEYDDVGDKDKGPHEVIKRVVAALESESVETTSIEVDS